MPTDRCSEKTHCRPDGITVRLPGNISPVGVGIAIRNKSLRCLFVTGVTSMKYTSGCIATRRTMSSVARDTSISNFLLGNLRDFRSSAISSSISSGVSKHFFVTSLIGQPLVVYENRPSPVSWYTTKWLMPFLLRKGM